VVIARADQHHGFGQAQGGQRNGGGGVAGAGLDDDAPAIPASLRLDMREMRRAGHDQRRGKALAPAGSGAASARTGSRSAETRAVVVMANGKLAAERYGPGYDKDTRFVSWSMAKTVTAVLIGMLVADGKLALDAPAPVPLWQRPGDPRAEITLRHLLQMRSGLRHTESGRSALRILRGADAVPRRARQHGQVGRSSRWRPSRASMFEYSSNTTVILADIAARALTTSDKPEARRKAVADYLQVRLFGPLGMTSMVPEFDASAR
jgi:CubicO group peptidase (beta-lactamase class C family)